MVNKEIVSESVIKPVLLAEPAETGEKLDLLQELKDRVLISDHIEKEAQTEKIVNAMISGNTLFLLEGYSEALVISSKGWQSRSITEPEAAKVIRGPREGFTESILVNLSLVRRKIGTPELKFRFTSIGERTHTKTCICYIEGLASEKIMRELEKRLSAIKIDGILDSGMIQELIKDAPFSPFETVGASERPDVVASKLLEGRIALFVDGSPFVLTVPFVIFENINVNEDYYTNYLISSINRLLRAVTAVTTITIPAIFLSIVNFHQEMIPTPLLLSMSAARHDVPIPSVASLFIMLFIFDILREATTRMPVHISQAISIIGTIILGQAAVEARLVSAPVLIVTALTGITTLINMNFIGAAVIFRYFLLSCAYLLGIYGFILGFIVIYLHMMSIRSFGVPYMLGSTKVMNHDGQDIWVRVPWWTMTLRPKIIGVRNLIRQSVKKAGRNS
jgi:spore germination protein KA